MSLLSILGGAASGLALGPFGAVAGGIIAAVAPSIASALAGPLAGQATTAVVNALGLAPDTPPAQIEAAVQNASVDDLAKLRQADGDFAVQMRKLDVDLERIASDDRGSARAREIAVHDRTPELLAYMMTAGFFALLAFMCLKDLPAANANLLYVLLGSLGTGWIASVNYFFGSTAGSRSKDTALANSIPTSALPAVATGIQ